MKTAIVVLADIETHEALGRAVNAMVTALDFKEAGDERATDLRRRGHALAARARR